MVRHHCDDLNLIPSQTEDNSIGELSYSDFAELTGKLRIDFRIASRTPDRIFQGGNE